MIDVHGWVALFYYRFSGAICGSAVRFSRNLMENFTWTLFLAVKQRTTQVSGSQLDFKHRILRM